MSVNLLQSEFRLGRMTLRNRMVMAPMSRHRATEPDHLATPLGATYYEQRATTGLIIAEGTLPSARASGFPGVPGLFTDHQVAAWRATTDAVHDAGGHIFVQLWHCGRVSCREHQPDGALPIAPSAINADSFAVLIGGRQVPTVTPRALETDEIPGLIAEFVAAAENAVRAGFDGVELHAANGYLLHQFLSEQSNRRQDRYGGTPENRCRFVLEVASAVAQAIGADRVGIRISPVSGYQNALIGDPVPTFGHLLDHLDRLRLGYVHVVEGFAGVSRDDPPFDYRALRQHFSGVWIANNMYDPDLAEQALANGAADLVSFGRPFIANPDLVRRYRDGSTLNAINPDTLFAEGEVGYTDYPALG